MKAEKPIKEKFDGSFRQFNLMAIRIESLEKALAESSTTVEELRQQVAKSEVKIKGLEKLIDRRVDQAKWVIDNYEEELAGKGKDIKKLQWEMRVLDSCLEVCDSSNEALMNCIRDLEGELYASKQEIASLRDERKQALSELRDEMAATKDFFAECDRTVILKAIDSRRTVK
jgi:chromosome segregation ATPase